MAVVPDAVRAARASRLPAVVAVLLGVLVVAALPWWRPADPITGRTGILSYAPSGIAAELRRLAPAGTRVLAAQTWTSFLEWAAPDARYFLDSRFELFPADVWADRATIAAGGPAADEVLKRWGVDLWCSRRARTRADRLDRGLRGRRRSDPDPDPLTATGCPLVPSDPL